MKLIETYMETGSIAETARRWHTSRNVVRKWVERYRDDGVKGLGDRSRRPHRSPTQTQAQTEDVVVEAKKATGYGRKRLAWYLRAGEGARPVPTHDPPHPPSERVHGAQDEEEDVLPCPLGRGRRRSRSTSLGWT